MIEVINIVLYNNEILKIAGGEDPKRIVEALKVAIEEVESFIQKEDGAVAEEE